MEELSKRYSLWLSPKGGEAKQLDSLIAQLADKTNAPIFIPHISLAGKIGASNEQLAELKQRVDKLAESARTFTVTLSGYGYKNEIYRCLYLIAQSIELNGLYELATQQFPQIKTEHFQEMPHLSVMYGNYSDEVKQKLIAEHPLEPMTFQINSIDLCLTEGSEAEWHQIYSANLSTP